MDTPAELTATMASVLRHAWITGNSAGVLRYLGRPLTAAGKDRELLQAISDADFTVSGITNAALRRKLCSTSWGGGRTDKQLSARITRHLRLLRDHGLIRKLPHRHRYHLTDKGRQLTTALSALLAASTEQLLNIAA